MRVRFFTIPIHGGETATAEFNQFLASERVLSLDRHFIANGEASAWAICATYVVRGDRGQPQQTNSSVDYRDVLPE